MKDWVEGSPSHSGLWASLYLSSPVSERVAIPLTDIFAPKVRPADLEVDPLLSRELAAHAEQELTTTARLTANDMREQGCRVLLQRGYVIRHEGGSAQPQHASVVLLGETLPREISKPRRELRAVGVSMTTILVVTLVGVLQAPSLVGAPSAGFFLLTPLLLVLLVPFALLANIAGTYESEVIRVRMRSREAPAPDRSHGDGMRTFHVAVEVGEASSKNRRMGWIPGGGRWVRFLDPGDWEDEEVMGVLQEIVAKVSPPDDPWSDLSKHPSVPPPVSGMSSPPTEAEEPDETTR